MTDSTQGRKKKKITYTASPQGIKNAEKALVRLGFESKINFANSISLSRSTITKFFSCQPIQFDSFKRICEALTLDWKEIVPMCEEQQSKQLEINEFSNLGFSRELEKPVEFDSTFFYIERPPLEVFCYEMLSNSASLLRIKAPKLMGKTWLINRMIIQSEEDGYCSVRLDFRQTPRSYFTQLDQFLRWFCINITRQLRLPNHLNDYWDEETFGSQVSCTTYFEEYLLHQLDNPLALFLDHVDQVFPYPEIAEDFLGLLRSWHDGASSRNIWKKLRLFLVHREFYPDLNINQSPFNVGKQIELKEFNQQQVFELLERHQLNWDITKVNLLMNMMGGYPYLVQEAFSHLKTHKDTTLTQFIKIAPTESGIYGNHLRQHWSNLQKFPDLAILFKEVITANSSIRIDPILASKLHSMGLVRLQGNDVTHSCRLYREYFRDRLGVI